MNHELIIHSLSDARLTCSCGRWICSVTGTLTEAEARERHSAHAAAVTLGRLGGLKKSPAKTESCRANGKLGGRPKVKCD